MKTRTLGRCGLELSPFGLLVHETESAAAPSEVPNWCDVPIEVNDATWHRVVSGTRPDAVIVARVGPTLWDRGMLPACSELLARINRRHVDLLQLSLLDVERVKAGEPFRMMIKLKELGHATYFSMRVSTLDDALWAIEHTPVHAVTLDLEYDARPWTKLFKAAEEAGTGLIGTTRTAGGELAHARELLASTSIAAFSWPARLH